MQKRVDELAKTSRSLMLKEPFYGFFLIMLNKVWNNKKVPTACVSKNGINYQLTINETFWDSLSEDHRLGILKHELLHIAMFHLTTHHTYPDHQLANIAMDMEINQYIDEAWLPSGELSKEEYKSQTQTILQNLKLQLDSGSISDEEYIKGLKEMPSRGIMIKDYDELNLDLRAGTRYYYDKLSQAKEEKEKNGSSGCESFDELCDQMDKEGDPCNHDTWDEFDNLSEAEGLLVNKQLDRLLRESASQALKKRGTVPGEVSEYIKNIDKKEPPKFDWKGYIRRFTGISTRVFTKKLKRKPNKRYDGNPGLKIKMKQHMLLAIDTSGSVSNEELVEFMQEINHIYNTGVAVTVIQCDTAIKSIKEYKGKVDEMTVHGRGGTEFDPVLEYYNANLKRYTSLVYFTDGECYASVRPKAPVLWVLSERSNMNQNLPGKTIKLEL